MVTGAMAPSGAAAWVWTGRWRIEVDQLCIDLATAADSGCYEVWASGNSIELRPTGPGLVIHGVIEKPADRN
jgi:hypothetical protein